MNSRTKIAFLKLPQCMVPRKGTLLINTLEPECLEYLAKVKESNSKVKYKEPPFKCVTLSLGGNYHDVPSIFRLLDTFNIERINAFHKRLPDDLQEIDEDTVDLLIKTAGIGIRSNFVERDSIMRAIDKLEISCNENGCIFIVPDLTDLSSRQVAGNVRFVLLP